MGNHGDCYIQMTLCKQLVWASSALGQIGIKQNVMGASIHVFWDWGSTHMEEMGLNSFVDPLPRMRGPHEPPHQTTPQQSGSSLRLLALATSSPALPHGVDALQ
jgi:hypothetical protein